MLPSLISATPSAHVVSIFVVRRVNIIAKCAYYLRYLRPSAHTYQRGPHSMDYREIWYFRTIIENLSRKSKFGYIFIQKLGTILVDLMVCCCQRN